MSSWEELKKRLTPAERKEIKKAEAALEMIRNHRAREKERFRRKEQEHIQRIHKYDYRWTQSTAKIEELRQKAVRGEEVSKKVGVL